MVKDEATEKKTSSLATEKAGGEVDYRTKSGTAWSHNFLNQKPWHPLSYPNQRRKWIAEQTHAQRERRAEEVAREYAQEQEYFRQTALVSKKEQEKLELMKAVSFMYVKPPGYNAESAKAAETADEKKMQEPEHDEASDSKNEEAEPPVGKKKRRVKDLYGRALPTEEEFEVLKNAPRLETGVAARSKPFGIEIRNVKCLRCGKFGHQSGDRECPLKDTIMPIEENRLKRDDPLTAIQAQTEPTEPLKWELKQQPGMSPPRGGFNVDDPNQQIVAEDIFDEYGGFLGETSIPELLTTFNSSKLRKKSNKKKHKKRSFSVSPEKSDKEIGGSLSDERNKRSKLKKKSKRRKQKDMESSPSERGKGLKKTNISKHHFSETSNSDSNEQMKKSKYDRSNSHKHHQRNASGASDSDEPYISKHDLSNRVEHHSRNSSDELDYDERYRSKNHLSNSHRHIHRNTSRALDSDERYRRKHGSSNRHKHHHRNSLDASGSDERYRNKHESSHRHKHNHINASEASDSDKRYRNKQDSSHRHKHHHGNTSDASDSDERYRNKYDSSNRHKHHHGNAPGVSDSDELYRSKHDLDNRHRDRDRNSFKVLDSDEQYRSKHNRNDGSKHYH